MTNNELIAKLRAGVLWRAEGGYDIGATNELMLLAAEALEKAAKPVSAVLQPHCDAEDVAAALWRMDLPVEFLNEDEIEQVICEVTDTFESGAPVGKQIEWAIESLFDDKINAAREN